MKFLLGVILGVCGMFWGWRGGGVRDGGDGGGVVVGDNGDREVRPLGG